MFFSQGKEHLPRQGRISSLWCDPILWGVCLNKWCIYWLFLWWVHIVSWVLLLFLYVMKQSLLNNFGKSIISSLLSLFSWDNIDQELLIPSSFLHLHTGLYWWWWGCLSKLSVHLWMTIKTRDQFHVFLLCQCYFKQFFINVMAFACRNNGSLIVTVF